VEHHLRHVSASGGDLSNHWAIDDHDDKLLVSIRCGSAETVHLALVVRSVGKRVRARGEFGIWCISSTGEGWIVEHGCYDAHLDPPHPLLPAMSLLLTNAPEDVADRLRIIAIR